MHDEANSRIKSQRWVVRYEGFSTPCHVWLMYINDSGYGAEYDPIQKRDRPAHVNAWERVHGPVENGLQIDHLCRVRACVNPDHLEAVTPAENTRRGRVAKLTMTDARVIREMAAVGECQRDIAKRYGVAPPTVCNIVKGVTWRES